MNPGANYFQDNKFYSAFEWKKINAGYYCLCISYELPFEIHRVTRSLVLYVCFVDRCVSFCTLSFGHCVICSSIYGFWLPLWYLQTLRTKGRGWVPFKRILTPPHFLHVPTQFINCIGIRRGLFVFKDWRWLIVLLILVGVV